MGVAMDMNHEFADNVVTFAKKNSMASFPAIPQVDAYWEGLRAGRLMPNRSEVDPRGIETALEFAFMLEHVAPGVARFRIAGMHLSDILGMEVRGMPLTAMFDPTSRARISEIVERVITRPQVADITLKAERSLGRPAMSARLYMAPLATSDGGFPRILGCLQSDGRIGRAPRRFILDQAHTRRIVATAGAQVKAVETKPEPPAPDTEFAEPPAAFEAAAKQTHPQRSDAVHYLRLVASQE